MNKILSTTAHSKQSASHHLTFFTAQPSALSPLYLYQKDERALPSSLHSCKFVSPSPKVASPHSNFCFFFSLFSKGSYFCYRRFLRGYKGRGCMGRIFSLQRARSILPGEADYHAEHSSSFTRWPLVIAVGRPRCQFAPRHGRTQ